MYNIKCNQAEPYATPIATFIKREFPVLVKPNDSAVLDLLTEAILASGQIRFGPKPSPESQVAIREVITHWTRQSLPIPFMVPWGSEKPDGSGIDIAELFALKTLECLQHRVQAYYAPGVRFNVRVEDASAPHLFFDRAEQARFEAARYTKGFVKLAKVVDMAHFINILPESYIFTEADFNATADKILPTMLAHVINPNDAALRLTLREYGWTSPLSPETLDYYNDRYLHLYPHLTPTERTALLARYFAGALARKALGGTGVDKSWGTQYLELSFVPPIPGFDPNRAKRRIHYRTMPCSITSQHIAAWRGKGYLKINGEVTASMASFNAANNYNPNVITLTDGTDNVDVQADYIVTD